MVNYIFLKDTILEANLDESCGVLSVESQFFQWLKVVDLLKNKNYTVRIDYSFAIHLETSERKAKQLKLLFFKKHYVDNTLDKFYGENRPVITSDIIESLFSNPPSKIELQDDIIRLLWLAFRIKPEILFTIDDLIVSTGYPEEDLESALKYLETIEIIEKNSSVDGYSIKSTIRLHPETQIVLEKPQQLPEKIIVLFLAANPLDQQPLRLDEEARSINEMIRKARHRDSVLFKSCWAVRSMDILQALNEHTPAIVHFSGHGSEQDEIVFQDNNGNAKFISKEAIVQTMRASSKDIRLVFFNTCYSRKQALAVVEHVDAAIGMKTSIGDEAARVFASQFYSAIGFGLSVKKAFEQAKALLMMEGIKEEDTPELFVRDGLNPEVIVIVKPKAEQT